MFGVFAKPKIDENAGDDLFARIGEFLAAHHLSPEPAHYNFAHAVISDPDGPIAHAVARLTFDGVALSGRDVEELGGQVVPRKEMRGRSRNPAGPAGTTPPETTPTPANDVAEAAALAAEAEAQVAGFATMVKAMHAETEDFGRDLAAMSSQPAIAGIDEIARLTGSMLNRVRDAEERLARATREADTLRAKLAEANDTARTDVLTGLPNRRAFDEALLARDAANGPYCIAVCDIDRFKHINDRYGHVIGDRVLAAIAKTLAEQCSGHLVARYGGEEFAILMSLTELPDAVDRLDRVRSVIANKRYRVRETDQPLDRITMSFGVTTLQPDEDGGRAYDRADRHLYTAKADGRDRVCAA
ncbi:diguanylate cyclase [Sphingomonas jinjuensis]|uniref:diguanylate cyclase n=1 Tax=Sphingomonas jinjuensis TaxID=535907 RepID=A0A840F6P6_9SPHN|nr:GGDEF domain-containing protein [Sphingomonas jinjuensis]MBB4152141.1 diguanylate cyclase [Sphingomonas jinjuensis]